VVEVVEVHLCLVIQAAMVVQAVAVLGEVPFKQVELEQQIKVMLEAQEELITPIIHQAVAVVQHLLVALFQEELQEQVVLD
jgi:hypothetical protein